MRSSLIRKYYACIDRNELESVISLFSDDAVYQRADSRYDGKKAIDHFFRHVRGIRGRHVVDDLWSFEDGVICTGEFDGCGEAGDARKVRFADFWFFNGEELVVRRETYLALGQQYIKG